MTSSSLLLTVVFSVLEATATVGRLRLITTWSTVMPPARLLLRLLFSADDLARAIEARDLASVTTLVEDGVSVTAPLEVGLWMDQCAY